MPDAPDLIPVPAGALRQGQVVAGRYEISGRLGAGGMGSVWRAHDQALDEHVALKVILPERLADPRAHERFRAEVKTARRITHPNICRVFDLGEDGGLTFLTMELVEGSTLRELLAAGSLDPARALDLFQQVVSGVEAVHALGIVHRDLKPENVLVRRDGRALVADFGLARDPGLRLISSAALVGTPAYMSPEQLRGEPLGVRSDVFALGILGYELLTRRSPFGEALAAAMGIAAHDPPPALDVPGLPETTLIALRELFACALARSPADRFPSAAELGAALARARAGADRRSTLRGLSRVSAAPQSAPKDGRLGRVMRRFGLPAALIIAAIGGAGLGWRMLQRRTAEAPVTATPAPEQAQAVIAVLPFENLTGEADWNGLSRSAPEAIRARLRTLPEARLAEAAPRGWVEARALGITHLVRGNVQSVGMGPGLRLFAQIESVESDGNARGGEPVEIDAGPEQIAQALATLRERAVSESLIVVRRHEQRRRAITGTASEVARAKLLQYYAMVGLRPRTEQYPSGLQLLDAALAADPSYVPALVERALLLSLGAGAGTDAEKMAQSLADLEVARGLRPDDPEVSVMRCRVLQVAVIVETHPTDAVVTEATQACRDALAAAPASAHVHIALARLSDYGCRDEDAMRILERAVEFDPNLSGRALKHLAGLALSNHRMALADRASERLVSFWKEDRRLGARAVSQRAGAPEVSGVYMLRGAVLLRLERFDDAKLAFDQELEERAGEQGNEWAEAAALRGLNRVAAARSEAFAPLLQERLDEIEAGYRAGQSADPSRAEVLVKAYLLVDPAAASRWIDLAKRPATCDEAFLRSRVHDAAGQRDLARAALDACAPVEEWERSCKDQHAARLRR